MGKATNGTLRPEPFCLRLPPIQVRLIGRVQTLSLPLSSKQENAVIYKGVEYTVVATAEPDIWEWRFEFGDRVRRGRTQTRLVALAARRVQSKIDAELRAAKSAVPIPKT
jgi:hypothetical protein